ncbi:AAA family ATPase [Candidatus Amarolinea dominans]|uniref:AAA family ATPase n=1 Tax=Candidatus Amarolinea dominans TaxID=3140696 RepID=UPI0031CC8D13
MLSDLSSGYNVAEDLSLLPDFYDLCGFHEAEVAALLAQVGQTCDLSPAQTTEALTLLRTFYNGYRFGMRATALIYNPTLTLYFLKTLQRECEAPRELLDSNLAMDRGKIAYIAGLPHGAPVLAAILNPDTPPTIPRLAQRFGVEDVLTQVKDETFMVSLLYYFGVLTLERITEEGKLAFRIPNLVARKLYVEQLRDRLLPEFGERAAVREAVEAVYYHGDLQPLCDFIETRYFRVLDNRDYRWANELTVKMAFLTLLFDDLFYITDSEPALERSYADMTALIVRPGYAQVHAAGCAAGVRVHPAERSGPDRRGGQSDVPRGVGRAAPGRGGAGRGDAQGGGLPRHAPGRLWRQAASAHLRHRIARLRPAGVAQTIRRRGNVKVSLRYQ